MAFQVCSGPFYLCVRRNHPDVFTGAVHPKSLPPATCRLCAECQRASSASAAARNSKTNSTLPVVFFALQRSLKKPALQLFRFSGGPLKRAGTSGCSFLPGVKLGVPTYRFRQDSIFGYSPKDQHPNVHVNHPPNKWNPVASR